MTIIKCDRCRKEIENPPYLIGDTRVSITVSQNDIPVDRTRKIDLCKDCIRDFVQFINNNK